MKSWQEAALFNTTQIAAYGSSKRWGGTGFFMLVSDKLFLVSNRHVLENDPTTTYSITIHRRSQTSTGMRLEVGSNVAYVDYENPIHIDFNTMQRYVAHPDRSIDLALVDLTDVIDLSTAVIVPFTISKIIDWSSSLLVPTQKLMFVGYPDLYSDRMHHLPIVRTGTIASLPMLDFDGEPIFLMDAQIWPGSSGSPVFASAEDSGGTFLVIGVIRSSVSTTSSESQLLGLGHAIKSSEIIKLLLEATGSSS